MIEPEKTVEERLSSLEQEVSVLRSRINRMAKGYVVLWLITIVTAYLAFHALRQVSANNNAGAVQRVTTISQRCDLTSKIKDVLVQDDPIRLPAFEVSYEECLVGLHKAEKLAGVKSKLSLPPEKP